MDFQYLPPPLGVSEYIVRINTALKQQQNRITGEISEVSFPPSGHVYFTLKDKKSDAIIKCVVWRTAYHMQGVKLQTGLELILNGKLEVYAPYGRIQYIASSIELVGEGQLKAAYDALKKHLIGEGLFAEERKRPLPLFPKKIGLITSQNGAVIHDFSNNVGRHNFSFYICDSRIEGKQSLPDLLQAVKTMANQDIELLIIMRGGGSLQSLAAFDTEALVRAISTFPVPVIAAVGHHQDKPLAALAADVHVSTPTAAAMILNKSWDDATLTINKYTSDIFTGYQRSFQNSLHTLEENKTTIASQLTRIISVFTSAHKKVEEIIMKSLLTISQYRLQLQQESDSILTNYAHTITTAVNTIPETTITGIFATSLKSTDKQLSHFEEIITLRDPRRMLRYGYSIIRSRGALVKSINDVRQGDNLHLLLSDGEILSRVEGVKDHE